MIITYVLLKPKKILMAIDHATEKSSPIMNKNNKQTEAQTTKVVSNRAPIRKKELSNKNHLHTYVLKLDATKPFAIIKNQQSNTQKNSNTTLPTHHFTTYYYNSICLSPPQFFK